MSLEDLELLRLAKCIYNFAVMKLMIVMTVKMKMMTIVKDF